MKKILLMLIAISAFMSSICFANYYDENPERYIVYDSTSEHKSYVDIESTVVRRYEPPYYTIDITSYTFDLINDAGYVKENRYFYDYDKQTIQWQILSLGRCDEDGNISSLRAMKAKVVYLEIPSSGYLASEFAFMKSYNMPFSTHLQKILEEKANQ